jgi:phospholipase C
MMYDEAGGFFDHVAPPAACRPSADPTDAEYNRLGFRTPFAAISPYSRAGYVSHRTYETASVTRFVEALFDLPALTARDANADVPFDLFDFTRPAFMTPPRTVPAAGRGGCP